MDMFKAVGDLGDICQCRHDRASHEHGDGMCGWCDCGQFFLSDGRKHARPAEPAERADLAHAAQIALAAIFDPALERLADELAARVVEQVKAAEPVVWAGRTFGELSPDEKRRAAASAGRQLSAELAANAENIARVIAQVTR